VTQYYFATQQPVVVPASQVVVQRAPPSAAPGPSELLVIRDALAPLFLKRSMRRVAAVAARMRRETERGALLRLYQHAMWGRYKFLLRKEADATERRFRELQSELKRAKTALQSEWRGTAGSGDGERLGTQFDLLWGEIVDTNQQQVAEVRRRSEAKRLDFRRAFGAALLAVACNRAAVHTRTTAWVEWSDAAFFDVDCRHACDVLAIRDAGGRLWPHSQRDSSPVPEHLSAMRLMFSGEAEIRRSWYSSVADARRQASRVAEGRVSARASSRLLCCALRGVKDRLLTAAFQRISTHVRRGLGASSWTTLGPPRPGRIGSVWIGRSSNASLSSFRGWSPGNTARQGSQFPGHHPAQVPHRMSPRAPLEVQRPETPKQHMSTGVDRIRWVNREQSDPATSWTREGAHDAFAHPPATAPASARRWPSAGDTQEFRGAADGRLRDARSAAGSQPPRVQRMEKEHQVLFGT